MLVLKRSCLYQNELKQKRGDFLVGDETVTAALGDNDAVAECFGRLPIDVIDMCGDIAEDGRSTGFGAVFL